ncbi:MAG: electron transfer flavoprotein subunit alpha/FixB family protein [bacterium]
MENKFLVIIEQRNGLIKKSSIEAACQAKQISQKFNSSVEAVIVGANVDDFSSLGNVGIDTVTFIKNQELEYYSSSAYAKLITDFVNSKNFEYIFISNSSFGKDLAPRLSAKLDCGLVMDCVKLSVESDCIIATRPIFAGKLLMQQKLNSKLKIFNLRPNVFGINDCVEVEVSVNTIEAGQLNLISKTIEVKKSGGKLDVAEADIIVSGGRGLKVAENFSLLENLAGELGAAVGASRAVVDAGWRPHSEQVGQTGKTVSPNLYFAVGISGAIQHIAGMRSSKYIVAINKDKDAPIFQIADYGIVADAIEILPILTEEIKKIKQ